MHKLVEFTHKKAKPLDIGLNGCSQRGQCLTSVCSTSVYRSPRYMFVCLMVFNATFNNISTIS